MTHELLLPAAGAIPLVITWARWKLSGIRRGGLRSNDKLPSFRALPASDGRAYSRDDLKGGRALVVIFTANRCPGAKAYDDRIAEIQRDFAPRGVRIIGVNSISADLYPTETLDEMRRAQSERGIGFPILKDDDQRLAHAFGAVCTPHVFLFDGSLRLRYRGRIDNAFVPTRVTQHHLRDALEAVLSDRTPKVQQTTPLGCAIDWVRPRTPYSGPSMRKRRIASRSSPNWASLAPASTQGSASNTMHASRSRHVSSSKWKP